jgi:hypothetical protein
VHSSSQQFVKVHSSLGKFVAVSESFSAVLVNRFHSSSQKFVVVCVLLQVLKSFKAPQFGKTFNKTFAYFKRPIIGKRAEPDHR